VQWRTQFYQKEGWRGFIRPADQKYAPHMMLHLLAAQNPRDGGMTVNLRELDDMEEWMRVMNPFTPDQGPSA
jgi:hypothetical protein